MGRAVSTLLSECVYFTGFSGRLLTSRKNMTEDDWRWHMYDTVRPTIILLAYMYLRTFAG